AHTGAAPAASAACTSIAAFDSAVGYGKRRYRYESLLDEEDADVGPCAGQAADSQGGCPRAIYREILVNHKRTVERYGAGRRDRDDVVWRGAGNSIAQGPGTAVVQISNRDSGLRRQSSGLTGARTGSTLL